MDPNKRDCVRFQVCARFWKTALFCACSKLVYIFLIDGTGVGCKSLLRCSTLYTVKPSLCVTDASCKLFLTDERLSICSSAGTLELECCHRALVLYFYVTIAFVRCFAVGLKWSGLFCVHLNLQHSPAGSLGKYFVKAVVNACR